MKKLIIALLLFPFFAAAQKTDSVLFKGATKIVIKNDLKSVDGLKLAVAALTDNGFNIDVSNADLGILRTEQKQVNAFGLQIVDVTSKDNQITLTTRLRTTLFDGTQVGRYDQKQFINAPYLDRKLIKESYLMLSKVAKSIGLPFVYSN